MDGWIMSHARGSGNRRQSCLCKGSSRSLVDAGRGGIIFWGRGYLQAISSPTLEPDVSPCGEQAWYHLLGGRERRNKIMCSSCACGQLKNHVCAGWAEKLGRVNKGQRDLGATQQGILSHFMSPKKLLSLMQSCKIWSSWKRKVRICVLWERQRERDRDWER